MTIDQNKAIVARFNHEIVAGQNPKSFDTFFDPEFVNRTVRPGYPTGPDGVLKFLSENLWKGFSDLRVEIHDQIAEGDLVTTRKTIHGTHTGPFLGQPASNKKIGIFLIDIIRLRNGKYLEHWGVFDAQNVVGQITG